MRDQRAAASATIQESIRQYSLECWVKKQVEQQASLTIQAEIRRHLSMQALQVAKQIAAKKRQEEEAILKAQREQQHQQQEADSVEAIQTLIRRRLAWDTLQQLKQERAQKIQKESALLRARKQEVLNQIMAEAPARMTAMRAKEEARKEHELLLQIRAEVLERRRAKEVAQRQQAQPQTQPQPQPMKPMRGVIGHTQEEQDFLNKIRQEALAKVMKQQEKYLSINVCTHPPTLTHIYSLFILPSTILFIYLLFCSLLEDTIVLHPLLTQQRTSNDSTNVLMSTV